MIVRKQGSCHFGMEGAANDGNTAQERPMLRPRFCPLALISVLGLTACSGGVTIEEAFAGEAKPFMPRDASKFAGTFANHTDRIGEFTQLVLKTDGSYHRAMLVVCFNYPCEPVQQDGLYKFSYEGTRTYLDFSPARKDPFERYEYSLGGDSMTLRAVTRPGEAFTMQRSAVAWCASSRDCALQNLPFGSCAGHYVCAQSACNYLCGHAPEIVGAGPKPRSGG
jgi:hypothetical protein